MGWSDVRVTLWTPSKVSQKSPFIKNTKSKILIISGGRFMETKRKGVAICILKVS